MDPNSSQGAHGEFCTVPHDVKKIHTVEVGFCFFASQTVHEQPMNIRVLKLSER